MKLFQLSHSIANAEISIDELIQCNRLALLKYLGNIFVYSEFSVEGERTLELDFYI